MNNEEVSKCRAGALRMRECSQEGGKTAVEEIGGLTINFIMLQS